MNVNRLNHNHFYLLSIPARAKDVICIAIFKFVRFGCVHTVDDNLVKEMFQYYYELPNDRLKPIEIKIQQNRSILFIQNVKGKN